MKVPFCTDDTCVFEGGSISTTLMAFIPQYNAKGELISKDCNKQNTVMWCRTHKRRFGGHKEVWQSDWVWEELEP